MGCSHERWLYSYLHNCERALAANLNESDPDQLRDPPEIVPEGVTVLIVYALRLADLEVVAWHRSDIDLEVSRRERMDSLVGMYLER